MCLVFYSSDFSSKGHLGRIIFLFNLTFYEYFSQYEGQIGDDAFFILLLAPNVTFQFLDFFSLGIEPLVPIFQTFPENINFIARDF